MVEVVAALEGVVQDAAVEVRVVDVRDGVPEVTDALCFFFGGVLNLFCCFPPAVCGVGQAVWQCLHAALVLQFQVMHWMHCHDISRKIRGKPQIECK